MTLVLPAPAKLNLFLHITGRRPDGYHELQTLFQLLDHGDELSFSARDDGAIHLAPDLPGIPARDNLVQRAAVALRSADGNPGLGADIHLHKRLPAGGGLGGGSSDAATTLLALNKLWGLGFSVGELAGLGLALGADVPVFVHGHTAWGEGIGERLTPVAMPPAWYLVLDPGCAVATGAIFGHRELTRNARPITIRAFLGEGAENHCQPVAEKLHPEVKQLRQWLEQYAPAQMTGTGACVFARFESEAEARRVFAARPVEWNGFVARGVDKSPVHSLL